MEINNHLLWIWAKELLHFNNKKLLRLIEHFGTIDALYEAEDFSALPFLSEPEIKQLIKKDLRSAWELYGDCEENHIGILTLDDEAYPELLREISNPPSPLFYMGNLQECLLKPALTIAGTRKSNGYGEEMTKEIATALCHCGITIVSGIAEGIDQFAYMSAVAADSGPIVVLPFGFLSNKGLYTRHFRDILARGALVSEAFPHQKTHRHSYHERNRILSGLSAGTLIVQAPQRSGALMTANYAYEQNRDVFAVMGNANSFNEGNNRLIKDGCYPVTDYTDILNIYLPRYGKRLKELSIAQENVYSMQQELEDEKLCAYKKKHKKELNEEEQIVFDLLSTEERSTDDIIEASALPVHIVLQALTSLEFRGLAVSCPGSKFKVIL